MVELDVRDRGHAEVEDVRRVQPAEPDLDDREVDPLTRELGDRGGRERLELRGWPDVGGDAVDRGQDPLDGGGEVGLARRPPSIAIRSR